VVGFERSFFGGVGIYGSDLDRGAKTCYEFLMLPIDTTMICAAGQRLVFSFIWRWLAGEGQW
jgi:hypothetical protein